MSSGNCKVACICGQRDAERYPDAIDRMIVPTAADCPVHGSTVAPISEPGPAWIPRESDEKPSDAMPSPGHADWREEAEWWQRTCEYWRGRALEIPSEAHEALLDVVDAAQAVKEHDDNDPRPLRPTLEAMYGALYRAGVRP